MSDAGLASVEPRPTGGWIGAFVRNPVLGKLVLLLLIVGGLVVSMTIPIQSLPEVDSRVVEILVPYPGAMPGEVEVDINRRLETSLLAVPGVRGVTAVASEGMALVYADIEPFVNADEVRYDIRTAVERIENFPPPFAERPEIRLQKPESLVLTLAIVSDELDYATLRIEAEKLRSEILSLPSVDVASFVAAPDRQITVEISEEQLRKYGVTIRSIASVISDSSLDLASGELRTESGGLVLRTQTTRVTGKEFEDIVLRSNEDGSVVRIGDVARIVDGFVDRPITSTLDGTPAIFLSVNRASKRGEPLVVVDDVKTLLANYHIPSGVDVSIWHDATVNLTRNLRGLLFNGLLGFALVFFALAVVFDFRIAVWVALGVPVSYLGAILLFPSLDIFMGTIPIFAFFLVTGIVVDDAVVVGESITLHQEQQPGIEGAIAGAREVRDPVVVGVITTMLAFVPLIFTYGAFGQYIQVLAIVVILVLLMSLVEAFFILPSHLSRSEPWSRGVLARLQVRSNQSLDRLRDRVVVQWLAVAIRRPILTILVSIALVAASVAVVASGSIRFLYGDYLINTQIVRADLRFPIGTPFDVTAEAASRVADAANLINQEARTEVVRSIAVVTGDAMELAPQLSAMEPASSSRATTHLASVVVHLNADTGIYPLGFEVEQHWRRNLVPVPGLESIRFRYGDAMPLEAVTYAIAHSRSDALDDVIETLRAGFDALPGVSATEVSPKRGKRYYDIELTRAGIAAGLSPRDVANELRARYIGVDVQRIQRGHDEIKVVVRYPEHRRHSLHDLSDDRIATPEGGDIPLALAASVIEKQGVDSQMRVDGTRAAEVSALFDSMQTSAAEIQAEIDPLMDTLLAKYPELRLVTTGTQKEINDVVRSLAFTVPFAIAAMYIIIAVLFRSFWMPMLVLSSIPFVFVGAIVGHIVLSYDLTVFSVMGIVAATGVVVNDTLVLLDRYRKIRAQADVPAVAAVSAATRQRFRPIMLTTVTTVVGLMPMLYFNGSITLPFMPMIVSMVFGLVIASLSILLLLPATLMLAESIEERQSQTSSVRSH
ncbi:MAG: efflux RND transporter permease subunit [Gammaproteobacteria bacterium]|nr:efflux RND transporter permease subunit [Gammaproteobacteria bacterium]